MTRPAAKEIQREVALTKDRILEAVDELRNETVELTAKLIAFGTIAKTGAQYRECSAFIASKLTEAGLDTQIIDVPKKYLERAWGANLEKTREYLEVVSFSPRFIVLASWPGSTGKPSLHLTQHYDLTQPEGSSFEARIEDGKIFGKGASEARAGTVVQIIAVKALKAAGVELTGDLFVSATPDNHIGGDTGAGYLVENDYGKSDMVITGGPSGVGVVTLGYKGCLWLKITTHGKKAHGSEPHEGVNAIEKMAEIQNRLVKLNISYAKNESSWPIDPPEANRPTLTMARIVADGTTVADECSLYVDRRLTPEESVDGAMEDIRNAIAELQAGDADLQADIETLHVAENPVTSGDGKVAQTIMRNIREVLRVEPKLAVWSYYSEFRCFPTGWGAETVDYSPGPPKIYRGPGEYVAIDDLVDATKVLALTINDLIG